MPDHVVAFPEKLFKTIATRCAIFSLKYTKNCLASGLRPDPLRELQRSPDPLAAIWGLLLRGGERAERREGRKWKWVEEIRMGGKEKGKEGRREEGEGRVGEGRGLEPPHKCLATG